MVTSVVGNTLPPPVAFGLPPSYTTWYPSQFQALTDAMDAKSRFVGQCIPTGGGKSLIAAALAKITGQQGLRTVYLTSTRALQDQVLRDFHTIFTDIRGQRNYPCVLMDGKLTVDEAPCHAGYKCQLREAGCEYYDQTSVARRSQFVITNYSYYMTQLRAMAQSGSDRPAIGAFDLLVCDEGHMVVDEIAEFMRFSIRREDCRLLNIGWPDITPTTVDGWIRWANEILPAISEPPRLQVDVMGGDVANLRYAVRRSTDARRAKDKIETLAGILDPTNWLLTSGDTGNSSNNNNSGDSNGQRHTSSAQAVMFSPVWPAKAAEAHLYRGAGKVLFLSATLTRKAMFLAGVPTDDYIFNEYPSSYPVANRRVTYIPTVAMNKRVTSDGFNQWVARIDQILRARPQQKVLIHTTSYSRMRELFQASVEHHRMIQHGSGQASQAIDVFRRSPTNMGAVLVSPVMHSGYDFKGDECRTVIIGKLPFPDSRDPMVKARSERDKEWIPHQVVQTLVQSAGRATRSVTDWSEIFIIDDDFWWFWNKYKYLAPRWFVEAVGKSNWIPEPRSG